MKAASTCFGLQGKHHQGATTSTQLKIQAWFNVETDVVQTLSVLWWHNMTCVACIILVCFNTPTFSRCVH